MSSSTRRIASRRAVHHRGELGREDGLAPRHRHEGRGREVRLVRAAGRGTSTSESSSSTSACSSSRSSRRPRGSRTTRRRAGGRRRTPRSPRRAGAPRGTSRPARDADDERARRRHSIAADLSEAPRRGLARRELASAGGGTAQPRGGGRPVLALAATVVVASFSSRGSLCSRPDAPHPLRRAPLHDRGELPRATATASTCAGPTTASGPCTGRARVDPRRRPRPGECVPALQARERAISRSPRPRSTSSCAGSWIPPGPRRRRAVARRPVLDLRLARHDGECRLSAAWVAILAIVLALERTSPARQLAVLGAVALAYLTGAVRGPLPAFVAALGLLWIVAPARRPRSARARRALADDRRRRAGPRPRRRGAARDRGSPVGLPSAYDDLWEAYDLVDVGRWVVYHLAALDVLLVSSRSPSPRSCSPRLLRAARAGDERAGAFAMAFLAVNAALILVAAAFSSTPAGLDHLHDRYLFYVVPLWLAVLGRWLADGLPRPSSRRPSGSASRSCSRPWFRSKDRG